MLCGFAVTAGGCDGTRLEDRSCQFSQWNEQEPSSSEFASGYFPESCAEPRPVCGDRESSAFVSSIASEWYPKQLHAACEAPLHKAADTLQSDERIVRLSVIPTWRPSVFVTMTKDADGYRGVAKEMTGSGGYSPGIIGRSKDFGLSTQEGARFERLLEAAEQEFDDEQRSFATETQENCFVTFDGTTWLIEVVDADGYRLIKVKNPNRGARFRLGQSLIAATGWEFDY